MALDLWRRLGAVALLAGAGLAQADSLAPVAPLPRYQAECGSCHTAYPPGLLPASSWQRLLTGLERHFGTDASLDAATVRELNTWLSAHAGRDRRAATAPPQDRITRAPWFVREHREIAPEVWQRARVKSAANCLACHRGAEQGRFGEREVRVPQ